MNLENSADLASMAQMPLKSGNARLVHWVAGAVLGLVLLWTLLAYVQMVRTKGAIEDVATQMQTAQAQLDQIKAQRLDAVIAAQQTADQVRAGDIRWSGILAKLLEVTPLDVFYRSYTASVDGKLSLSALSDDYDSAAQLLSVLNQTEPFSGVFTSSLARGSAESGSEVVSFGVTLDVQ